MKFKFFLLAVLFSFFSLSTAQTIRSNIPALSKKADIILTGKVTGQKSDWNKSKSMIFTEVTITVDEYLKGSSGGSVSFRIPGGEVGSIGELYTHVPKFRNSEEVLLFLKQGSKSGLQVLDGEAGKLTLYEDKKTGEKITAQRSRLSMVKKQIRNSLR